AELADAFLEVLKEARIEAGGVPLIGRRTFVRIERGLGSVVRIPLGNYTHPDLVERRTLERRESLFFKCLALMGPAVAGCADLTIRRAVGVGELKRVCDFDR